MDNTPNKEKPDQSDRSDRQAGGEPLAPLGSSSSDKVAEELPASSFVEKAIADDKTPDKKREKEIELIEKQEIIRKAKKYWDNTRGNRLLTNEEVNKGLQIVSKLNTTLSENREMADKEGSQ